MAEHCKRYDCLYHPDYKECHNCEYLLLTGKKRNSKPGRKCNKYVQATPKEQLELRHRNPIFMTDEDVWSNDIRLVNEME